MDFDAKVFVGVGAPLDVIDFQQCNACLLDEQGTVQYNQAVVHVHVYVDKFGANPFGVERIINFRQVESNWKLVLF